MTINKVIDNIKQRREKIIKKNLINIKILLEN